MDCLFCKIVRGEIPSNRVYEDDLCYAFYDIEPKAPVHFLVVPKQHIASAADLTESHAALVGHIYAVIAKLTKEMGLQSFRIVNNCGPDAGQTVFHLHFHVLAGKVMTEFA